MEWSIRRKTLPRNSPKPARATQQTIGEIRMRMLARQQEYDKEVENGLAEAQKEATSLDSRLKGLAFELANTEVRAPSEGVIVGLSVHTVGGVLAAGTPLMEVVPKNEPLRVDVQVPTTLIDKVTQELSP